MNALKNFTSLSAALGGLALWIWTAIALGAAINILSFTSPLFMMQLMDSIIPARDQTTLLILLGFGGGAFVALSTLDAMRRLISAKTAIWSESKLTNAVFAARGRVDNIDASLLGDVRQITAFMRSGASTLFDAPISLISFLVLFLVHPLFLLIGVVTAAIVLGASFLGSLASRNGANIAGNQRKEAMALADALKDAGGTGMAMGIGRNVEAKFLSEFSSSLKKDAEAASAGEVFSGASKFARQFAQITALAVGAILVMNGQLSGGAMIAASIIMGKALAPFDQLSNAWSSFLAASKSAETLTRILNEAPVETGLENITPEQIKPVLRLQNVTVPRGMGAKPILDRIDFVLHPGECLAIVGASGAGKTTLAEIVAGVVKPPMGAISIDGIPYGQLSDERKSAIIGFAPQSVQFFPGTITENIARFDPEASKEGVLDAVQRSETDVLIRDLSNGFDTVIDAKGRPLSLGNARRVSLARAIYGRPRVVVLDEPTSDLDEAGEKAIISLIGKLKSEGAAVVLIAQRAGLLAVADKLMQLDGGRLRDFGEKNEVLMRLSMRRPQIDLTPSLDETPRLIHWLGVHLSRANDGPLRSRAEIALVEIFNILRERQDVSAHEKISIVINMSASEIRFDVYSAATEPVFKDYIAAIRGDESGAPDLTGMSVRELSSLVTLSATHNLKEVVENNRLKISFNIEDNVEPETTALDKIAV